MWRSHHSLQRGRDCAIHTCGWQVFVFLFFFYFTAFISVPGVSAGSSANQRNDTLPLQKTDELPISLLCSISASFFISLSRPAPFLFSVICSLARSFSLINSLIKDTTSKSQLRALCLPALVRDGNRRKKQARRWLPLLLLLNSHPQLFVHLYHRQ